MVKNPQKNWEHEKYNKKYVEYRNNMSLIKS